MKTGVLRTRVDQVGQACLFYPAQPLEQRMLDEVKEEWGADVNQPVYRIVYELHFIHITKIGKITAGWASFGRFTQVETFSLKGCTITYG